jgi:hypothetical protein
MVNTGATPRATRQQQRRGSNAPIHRGDGALRQRQRAPAAPAAVHPQAEPRAAPADAAAAAAAVPPKRKRAQPNAWMTAEQKRDRQELIAFDECGQQEAGLATANDNFASPRWRLAACQKQRRTQHYSPSLPLAPVQAHPCTDAACKCELNHLELFYIFRLGSPSQSVNYKKRQQPKALAKVATTNRRDSRRSASRRRPRRSCSRACVQTRRRRTQPHPPASRRLRWICWRLLRSCPRRVPAAAAACRRR